MLGKPHLETMSDGVADRRKRLLISALTWGISQQGSCRIVILGREDSPCTRQSSLTLAAFRPWGSSQDDAARGAVDQSRGEGARGTK